MTAYMEMSRLKSDGDDFKWEEADTKDDVPFNKFVATIANAAIYNDGSEPSEVYEDTAFLMTNSDLPKVSNISPFDQEGDEEDGVNKRTGTLWTATAHIITGVIGAGVLSLAWSTAQLGWIAGPLFMIVFAVITLISTLILIDCYITHDSESGPIRHHSLTGAVKYYLGKYSSSMLLFPIPVFAFHCYGLGAVFLADH